eukprot:CAMPEP_0185374872 /NCGR_PEP_ID=MMETSP1364-20130426/34608_1 /TAXON_ID=38817 /ORGANISM="Gephyrocapsa oceanica, Strain RCC1303" /LENGTH=193 /DNA_ID=CAMNT_0027976101 /DNA_START=28 /DNA_END=606 /DNA_ORIENTATION=+
MAMTAPAIVTPPRADVLALGEAQPTSRTSSIHSHLSDGSREALGISRCDSFSNSMNLTNLTRSSSYESLDAIRRSFVWHPRMTLAERQDFERTVQGKARRSYTDSEGCLEYAPKARALRVSPAALQQTPAAARHGSTGSRTSSPAAAAATLFPASSSAAGTATSTADAAARWRRAAVLARTYGGAVCARSVVP